jgi:hypothetical protein
VRTFRRGLVAALTVAAFSSILTIRVAPAQETVMITEDAAPGADCNCKGVQRPPWHGSVRGPACGPACTPHGGMFHADPRGQLCMKHQARAMGATPPSYFPRLHTWCAEGYMPTPRPLALPHCRHCGMPLEDSGF